MANTFYLKEGDTHPNIETILSDSNGPVNLTGCTVTFRMSLADSTGLGLSKPATVVEPQTGTDIGKCFAEFVAGDTDQLGEYTVEWRVEFPNGKVATFPRGSGADLFNKIIIQPDVDPGS